MPSSLSPVSGPAPLRFVLFAFFLTIGSRFAFPLGSFSFPLVALFVFGFVLYEFARGLGRRLDFWAFAAFLGVTTMLLGLTLLANFRALPLNVLSLIFLLFLHLPFVTISDDQAGRLHLFSLYQKFMAFCAVAGVVQFGLQYVGGLGLVDPFGPAPDGFVVTHHYYNKLYFGSKLYKSTGMFFAEPSFFSRQLALAIILEVAFFGARFRYMVVYLLGILLAFSGTGPLMLLIAAPFFVHRLRIPVSRLLAGAFATVAIAAVVVASGWADVYLRRLSEFDRPGASGTIRFIAPWEVMRQLDSTEVWLFGTGAGSVDALIDEGYVTAQGTRAEQVHANTPLKMVVEYGLPAAILFLAFIFAMLRRSRTPALLAAPLALAYLLLTGGVLQANTVALLLAFGELYRFREDEAAPAPSSAPVTTLAPQIP